MQKQARRALLLGRRSGGRAADGSCSVLSAWLLVLTVMEAAWCHVHTHLPIGQPVMTPPYSSFPLWELWKVCMHGMLRTGEQHCPFHTFLQQP